MASKVARPASQSKVGVIISTSVTDGDDVVNGKGRVMNRRETNLAVRAVLVPEAVPLRLLRARAHAIDHFLKQGRLKRKIFGAPSRFMATSEVSIGDRHREIVREVKYLLSREAQLAASNWQHLPTDA